MPNDFSASTRRHSAAHVMAAAINDLFPNTKFGVGPATQTGFFYDVDLEHTLTESDLGRIEKRMKELRKKKQRFEYEEYRIDEAIAYMHKKGQPFKIELLKLLRDKGSTTVAKETVDGLVVQDGKKTVSFCKTGSFVDLCKGPHVDHSGQIGNARHIGT